MGKLCVKKLSCFPASMLFQMFNRGTSCRCMFNFRSVEPPDNPRNIVLGSPEHLSEKMAPILSKSRSKRLNTPMGRFVLCWYIGFQNANLQQRNFGNDRLAFHSLFRFLYQHVFFPNFGVLERFNGLTWIHITSLSVNIKKCGLWFQTLRYLEDHPI